MQHGGSGGAAARLLGAKMKRGGGGGAAFGLTRVITTMVNGMLCHASLESFGGDGAVALTGARSGCNREAAAAQRAGPSLKWGLGGLPGCRLEMEGVGMECKCIWGLERAALYPVFDDDNGIQVLSRRANGKIEKKIEVLGGRGEMFSLGSASFGCPCPLARLLDVLFPPMLSNDTVLTASDGEFKPSIFVEELRRVENVQSNFNFASALTGAEMRRSGLVDPSDALLQLVESRISCRSVTRPQRLIGRSLGRSLLRVGVSARRASCVSRPPARGDV